MNYTQVKSGDPCPFCGCELRLRYPHGDPENGPAEPDCKEGHMDHWRLNYSFAFSDLAHDIVNDILGGLKVDKQYVEARVQLLQQKRNP